MAQPIFRGDPERAFLLGRVIDYTISVFGKLPLAQPQRSAASSPRTVICGRLSRATVPHIHFEPIPIQCYLWFGKLLSQLARRSPDHSDPALALNSYHFSFCWMDRCILCLDLSCALRSARVAELKRSSAASLRHRTRRDISRAPSSRACRMAHPGSPSC